MTKLLNVIEKSLFLILLFSLPLIPNMFNRGYEETKVLGFLYLLVPCLIFFLINTCFKKVKTRFTSIHFLTGSFVLILIITAFLGIDKQRSLLGVYPYFQGAIIFVFFFLFTLILNYLHISEKTISKVLITSSTLVAAIALFQNVQLLNDISMPTYAGRVVSTFGQPNFYAGFLVLTLPFWLYLWRQNKQKEGIFLLASLAVIIGGIAVSFSKAAIFLTGLFFSIWLVNKYIKQKKLKLTIAAITLITFLSSFYLTGTLQKEIIDPIQKQTVTEGNAEKRIYIWQVSLDVIKQSPVFGYGLENIYLAFPKNFDFNHPKPAFYHSIRDLKIDRTHNLFLDLTLYSGLLGLISWITLFTIAYLKTKDHFIKMGLLLFLCWAMVQNLSIIHWIIFFIYLGLVRAKPIDIKRPQ